MKQMFLLARVQLGSVFDFVKIGRKKDKKKNTSTFLVLFVSLIFFTALSFSYSTSMAMSLKMFGELDVLPGLFMAYTCLAILATTFYKVKGTIFGFKDYDMVMSLPVKTSVVVASRLLLLYLINIFFTIVLMVPGICVYGYFAQPDVIFYLLAFLSIPFIPLVPMILAAAIGVVFAVVSSKFRYSNLVNLLLSIGFLLVFMGGSFFVQSDEQLMQLGSMFQQQMKRLYPLSAWFLKGIMQRDWIHYFLFLLISAGSFALFSLLVGAIFKKLNSSLLSKRTKGQFKFSTGKQQSTLLALYKKEAKCYFTTNIYFMNTAISPILLLIGCIALFVLPQEKLAVLYQVPELLSVIKQLIPFAIAAMLSLNATTASSISLEGKSLWIIKTSPVLVRDWFWSKIIVNMTLSIPAIFISSVLLTIFFQLSWFQLILSIVIPVTFCYLNAVIGLFVNLKLPIFDWSSETVVVKQSAASMIGMFLPMILTAVPILLILFVPFLNAVVVTLVTPILILAMAVGLHTYMNKSGSQILLKL